ncbi:hypothetical protein BH11PLA2_BH11PLA2_37870 [soil metagenome]
MFLGDDMIHFMNGINTFLRHSTVFATEPCSLSDLFSQDAIHGVTQPLPISTIGVLSTSPSPGSS